MLLCLCLYPQRGLSRTQFAEVLTRHRSLKLKRLKPVSRKARRIKQGMMQELAYRGGCARMSDVRKAEPSDPSGALIELFRDQLGYRFLGDWSDRAGNSNIEEGHLTAWLEQRGYYGGADQRGAAAVADRWQATTAGASMPTTRPFTGFAALWRGGEGGGGQAVGDGSPHRLEGAAFRNDFSSCRRGDAKEWIIERRPDLVLYLNGIAVGVLELKNSRVKHRRRHPAKPVQSAP